MPAVVAREGPDARQIDTWLETSSSVLIENADEARFDVLTVAARNRNHAGATPLTFEVSAPRIRVVRYETSWLQVDDPSTVFTPSEPTVNRTERWVENATVRYAGGTEWASTVLMAANAVATNVSSFGVRGTSADPRVVGQGSHYDGSSFNPGERGRWSLEGNWLSLDENAVDAMFLGPWRIYVANGAVELKEEAHPTVLESTYREEPVAPSSPVVRKTSIWHELDGTGSGQFTFTPSDGQRNLVLAGTTTLTGVSAASFDSRSTTASELLPLSPKADSLWLTGDLATTFFPSESGSTYRVTLQGRVEGFATAGGPPVWFTDDVRAASFVAGLLVFSWAAVQVLRRTSAAVWVVGLFSRLTSEAILGSRVRRQIMNVVVGEPGVSFADLRQRVTAVAGGQRGSVGLLVHHLRVLERHNRIRSTLVGRHRRFFASTLAPQVAVDQALIRVPRVQPILEVLATGAGISEKTLLSRLNETNRLGRTALRHHMRRLLSADVVRRERVRNAWTYSLTDRAASLLLQANPARLKPDSPLPDNTPLAPEAPAALLRVPPSIRAQ